RRLGGALAAGPNGLRPSRRSWRLPACGARAAIRRRYRDLGAVTQPISAVDNDAFAGLQPGQDRYALTVGRPGLYLLNRDRVVLLDEIDKGAGCTALYRRARDDLGILPGIDQQLHIDELVGEKDLLLVVEYCPKLDGARRRIDLVVYGVESALREFGRA